MDHGGLSDTQRALARGWFGYGRWDAPFSFVSPKVVRRLVEQNLLDALVVNEKLWFIPQDSIDRYVAARVDKK